MKQTIMQEIDMETQEVLRHLLDWDLHPEAHAAIIEKIEAEKDKEAPMPDFVELAERK